MGQRNRIVKLENAVNGQGYTSERRARHYVAEGRALWVNERTIRFRDESERHQEIRHRVESERDGGLATRQMIRNLPVVGNISLLLTRRTKAAQRVSGTGRRATEVSI